jgi:hypothetical protein
MKENGNFVGLARLPVAILIVHTRKTPVSAFVRI